MTKKKIESTLRRWCGARDIAWRRNCLIFADQEGQSVTITFRPDESRAVTLRCLFEYVRGLDAGGAIEADLAVGAAEPEVSTGRVTVPATRDVDMTDDDSAPVVDACGVDLRRFSSIRAG